MPNEPTTQPATVTVSTAKCRRCGRTVETKQKGAHRVLRLHGPDPSGSQFCGNSGGPAPK